MVFLLLVPKFDQNTASRAAAEHIVRKVLYPKKKRVKVAICQDGRTHERWKKWDEVNERKTWKMFYHDYMKKPETEVECWHMTFRHGDIMSVNTTIDELEDTDVFFMCGMTGDEPCPPLASVFEWRMNARDGFLSKSLLTRAIVAMIDRIVDLVRRDRMAYVGSCGGAKLAGKTYFKPWMKRAPSDYSVHYFDFCNGLEVEYRSSEERSDEAAFPGWGGCTLPFNNSISVCFHIQGSVAEAKCFASVRKGTWDLNQSLETVQPALDALVTRIATDNGIGPVFCRDKDWPCQQFWVSLRGVRILKREDGTFQYFYKGTDGQWKFRDVAKESQPLPLFLTTTGRSLCP